MTTQPTMLSQLEDIKRSTGLEGSAADVDTMAATLGLTLAASGLASKVDELTEAERTVHCVLPWVVPAAPPGVA